MAAHLTEIKQVCRQLRLKDRLSVDEIVDRTGVSRGTLHSWIKDLPLSDAELRARRINVALKTNAAIKNKAASHAASADQTLPIHDGGKITSGMNSIQKGDLTVHELILIFMRRKYVVLRPISECCRYDLAIDRGSGVLEKVQCKTGLIKSGSIEFRTESSVPRFRSGAIRRSYHGEIDLFGVFCHESHSGYLVPIAVTARGSTRLRLDQSLPKLYKGTLCGDDYRL